MKKIELFELVDEQRPYLELGSELLTGIAEKLRQRVSRLEPIEDNIPDLVRNSVQLLDIEMELIQRN